MRHARDVLVTALILTVLGVGAGFAWSAVAPPARYVTGVDGPRLADPATQNLIAADGLFALITAGAGLVCGILAFAFARRTAVLVGLALGGAAGALVAVRIGSSAGSTVVQAAVQTGAPGAFQEGSRLDVTAQGVLLAWPLLAVATFGLLEAVSAYLGSEYRARQRQAMMIADLSQGVIVSPGVRAPGGGRRAGRHARTRGRGRAPDDPPRGGRSPGRRRADPNR
jgi:hypothetical protein